MNIIIIIYLLITTQVHFKNDDNFFFLDKNLKFEINFKRSGEHIFRTNP